MSKKRTLRIVLGFTVCAGAIIILAAVAFHTQSSQLRWFADYDEVRQIAALFDDAKRAFDVTVIARLRAAETDDKEAVAEFEKRREELLQLLREAESRTSDVGPRDILEMAMLLTALSRDVSKLADDRRKIEEERLSLAHKSGQVQDATLENLLRSREIQGEATAGMLKDIDGEPYLPKSRRDVQHETDTLISAVQLYFAQSSQMLSAQPARLPPHIRDEIQKRHVSIMERLTELQETAEARAKTEIQEATQWFDQSVDFSIRRMKLGEHCTHIDAEMQAREAEMHGVFARISDHMGERARHVGEFAYHAADRSPAIILVTSVVGIVFCVFFGALSVHTVTSREIRSEYDAIPTASAAEGTGSFDSRLVAEKLQEVVDLLRR